MSWPRRHELIDIDLDAYADDADAPLDRVAPQASRRELEAVEEVQVSSLEAAERAGIPLEELLRGLSLD